MRWPIIPVAPRSTMLFMATFLSASFLRRASFEHSAWIDPGLTAQGYPNPQPRALSFIYRNRKLQRKGITTAPLLLPPPSHTHRTAAQSPSNASRSAPDAPNQPTPISARSYGTPQTPVPAIPPPSNPQTAHPSYPISTAATPPPQSLPQTPQPTPKPPARPKTANLSYPITTAATPPPQSLPQTPQPTPKSSAPSTS